MNLRGAFSPYSREPLIATIAIVGAGFSGTVVAINYLELKHRRPFRILLIDRDEFGRGIAYASRRYPYLLNVPVGGMSASCADPLEFLKYLQCDLPLATTRGPHLKDLRANGTLHVHAGHLTTMQVAGKHIRVRWRPRGENTERTLVVSRVINCTGPDYDVRSTDNRLLHSLIAKGLAAPDPLGLGLQTDEFGALRGASGQTVPDLYYVGPLLCANHWDAVESEELRAHAEHLARHLTAQRPRRMQPFSARRR